jgi:opacity protein-like surface antigen
MDIKQPVFGLACMVFGCTIATAGDMGTVAPPALRPVVSLQGGYASIGGGKTQSFVGTDSDVFTYSNSGSKDTGFIGVFLGGEYRLSSIPVPRLFMQTGVEYNYFGNIGAQGINTVGIEPKTVTTYSYHYNFETQQVLATLRLLTTTYARFHPYGEVGIGAAFNHLGQYHATTTETGSINLTPIFDDGNTTQFSYVLGAGIDTDVSNNLRVGVGYRYSNFGSASLGKGTVILNSEQPPTFESYQAPVSFTLSKSNAYTNALIVHISYVI